MTIPRHSISIRRQALLAEVVLKVGGRDVAETTLPPDVKRSSKTVKQFVHGYFHLPMEASK